MVHPQSVRRDNDRLPVWLQRCKAVFEGRALAIAAPLALTLVFGLIFSFRQAPYVNQNPQNITADAEHHLSGMQSQASNLTLDKTDDASSQKNDSVATNQAPAATGSSSSPSTAAQAVGNQVLGAATEVCNSAAKALATLTEQTATTAENTRHNKLITQIESNSLLGSLLSKTNLAAEDTLHMLNLQKIANTYIHQLQAAGCA